MREIKFRAWDGKKMFFPSSISWKNGIMWCSDMLGNNRYETVVGKSELMQFTGLKDYKGIEVYEGDYLKCSLANYSGLCEWVYNEARFVIRHLDKSAYHGKAIEVGNCRYNWSIIGNIYENPELIKS